MLVDEAIETLRYEIDEECHCDYIADEIRLLISAYESLIEHEERAHQHCRNVCEPKYKAEIERLADSLKLYRNYNPAIKHACTEAIKEFADRVKAKCQKNFNDYAPFSYVTESEVDNLLKEMVGEDK